MNSFKYNNRSRSDTTVNEIWNSTQISTAIIYYIFQNKPSRRCNIEITVTQFTA